MLTKIELYADYVSNARVALQLITISFKEYVFQVLVEGLKDSDVDNMQKIVKKLVEIQTILESRQ
jgi:hypothetical protein